MSAVHEFKLKRAALAVSLCMLGTAAMADDVAVVSDSNVFIIGNSNNDAGLAGTEGVYIKSNGGGYATVEVTATAGGGSDIKMDASRISMDGTTTITGNTSITGTLSATGNTTVGGTLSATGNTTLGGSLSVANDASVDGALNTTGNTSVGGALSVTGTSTLSGATAVNNTLSVNSGAGATELSVGTNSVSVLGATNVNTSGAQATTIGANGNTTSLNSNAINVGTGAYNTAVTLGSNRSGTVVNASGGDSNLQIRDGSASLTSGNAGYQSHSSVQTVGGQGGYALQNGNAASQAIVQGAQVQNIVTGNTLVDGDMYINGTLVYSSNTSATTNVVDSAKNTSGAMTIVNTGEQGAVLDANGKIGFGTAKGSTASLTVTNEAGNTHGIVVNESQTTMSGGTRSSSLTLDDRGATFSNSATGAPVKVTGVADGRDDFDAVNVRQYANAIAGVVAAANVPGLQAGKNSSIGVGMGYFMGKTALALGFNHRFGANSIIKASVASGTGGGSKPVVGVGAGFSW